MFPIIIVLTAVFYNGPFFVDPWVMNFMFDCMIIICYRIFALFFDKNDFFQFNFVENKKYFFTFVVLK